MRFDRGLTDINRCVRVGVSVSVGRKETSRLEIAGRINLARRVRLETRVIVSRVTFERSRRRRRRRLRRVRLPNLNAGHMPSLRSRKYRRAMRILARVRWCFNGRYATILSAREIVHYARGKRRNNSAAGRSIYFRSARPLGRTELRQRALILPLACTQRKGEGEGVPEGRWGRR